jgi:hypothetical protein
MSEPQSPYIEAVARITSICRQNIKKFMSDGLAVFEAVRKKDGETVYLLGFAENLDEKKGVTKATEISIVAEFVTNEDIPKLYSVTDYWIPSHGDAGPGEEEVNPLPNNVYQFRKKK